MDVNDARPPESMALRRFASREFLQCLVGKIVGNEPEAKEAARNLLREQRFESTYADWARELRASTWVEVRDAP